MPASTPLQSFPDANALHEALAALLCEAVTQPSPTNEPYALMLSGGSTPLPAYQRVTERAPEVGHASYFMLSDERMVPADSADSNFYQLSPLFNALALPRHRLLLVNTEFTPTRAAEQFHQELEAFFQQRGRIALGLLGLGTDGHTASLFTPADLERSDDSFAVAVDRADGRKGVSVTPRTLQRAERILFVVTGEEKRDVLTRFMEDPTSLTAGQAVAGHPRVEVWTDQRGL